jgi:hypothetical protein
MSETPDKYVNTSLKSFQERIMEMKRLVGEEILYGKD